MQKSPMAVVLERFGKQGAKDGDRAARRQNKDEAKSALVDRLAEVLERPEDEEKEAFKQRLSFVPSAKLLKLEARQEQLKKQFGTKQNLVEAILANAKRSKDEDYRRKLLTRSVGELLTMAPKKTAEKAAPKKAAAPKAAAEKKPAAKKPAAKKPAAKKAAPKKAEKK